MPDGAQSPTVVAFQPETMNETRSSPTFRSKKLFEAMRLEPGVRVRYSLQKKKAPTSFVILEICESEEAYRHRIQTPYFRKYEEGTADMVTSIEFVDCDPLVSEALIKPRAVP